MSYAPSDENPHRGYHAQLLDACAEYRAKLDQLERDNAELIGALESMVNQHCHTGIATRDYNGQVAGTLVTDSGALTANAQAIRILAGINPPRFRIVAEFGRMVVGYWPENDPKKHQEINP